MPDQPTVSRSPDGPAPEVLRLVVEKYWSAYESAHGPERRPSAEDILVAVPERDRERLRSFISAFDVLVTSAAAGRPAQLLLPGRAAPDTVREVPEQTVQLPAGQPAGNPDDSTFTRDFSPGAASASEQGAARTPGIPSIPGYEILDELGRGGMGIVFKAMQVRLRRLVAVKLMLQADYAGSGARSRFAVEAEAVARMQHPNIVQVFEIGEVEGKPFFSLEFVGGGTLSEKVAQHLLTPKETARMMVTLARAMQYAHDHGIVHRDLKPVNVLLTEEGVPKITDFGLAKKLEEDSGMTRMGTIVGTPSFMPPEQAAGEVDKVGKSADIYSLGAILYDLLTGRPPFKGANIFETLEQVRSKEPLLPSSLQPGVPADLETICLKCLQKDPARRYASAGELADDVQRFLDGEPILARPIGSVERAWRWCKRNKRVAGLLGTVAALMILITAGSTTAAVFINKSREQIRAQRDEIATQKDTIGEQLVTITAKEKLAADRLEAYRSGVDAFVNEAPSILEGNPLARGATEEMLQLTVKLLEDSQGKADDAGLTDRGKLSIILRQMELARVQAADRNLAKVDRESKGAEAARLLNSAERQATAMAAEGQPERDKNTGNLALVLNLQATEARNAKDFREAIRLHNLALEHQLRVRNNPDSGEISAAEADTWIGGTQVSLATTHIALGRSLRDVQGARREYSSAKELLEAAKKNLHNGLPAPSPTAKAVTKDAKENSGTASIDTTERLAERLWNRIGLAELEYGRVCQLLEDTPGVDAGFGAAVRIFEVLERQHKNNMSYKLNLTVASAEYGDILLMRRRDPVKAFEFYKNCVFFYVPIARPRELEGPLSMLALNYYRAATAARGMKDEATAKRVYGYAVEIRETLLRAAERQPGSNIQRAKTNLMLAQARYGQYEQASALAAELAGRYSIEPIAPYLLGAATNFLLGRGPRAVFVLSNAVRVLYDGEAADRQHHAACSYALSAEAVPSSNSQLRAQLMKRAFDCLESAIRLGYRDREALDYDPDFEPLRADPRFADILKNVPKQ